MVRSSLDRSFTLYIFIYRDVNTKDILYTFCFSQLLHTNSYILDIPWNVTVFLPNGCIIPSSNIVNWERVQQGNIIVFWHCISIKIIYICTSMNIWKWRSRCSCWNHSHKYQLLFCFVGKRQHEVYTFTTLHENQFDATKGRRLASIYTWYEPKGAASLAHLSLLHSMKFGATRKIATVPRSSKPRNSQAKKASVTEAINLYSAWISPSRATDNTLMVVRPSLLDLPPAIISFCLSGPTPFSVKFENLTSSYLSWPCPFLEESAKPAPERPAAEVSLGTTCADDVLRGSWIRSRRARRRAAWLRQAGGWRSCWW